MPPVALLWQDLIRQRQTTSEGLLPPILPIVPYDGDRKWTAPNDLGSLIAVTPDFLASFQPQARQLFVDENRASTANELGLRNPAAAVFAPTGLLKLPRRATISIDEAEPMMATRILKNIEWRMAEREARGHVKAICHLVSAGALTAEAARVQLKAMIKAKTISHRRRQRGPGRTRLRSPA